MFQSSILLSAETLRFLALFAVVNAAVNSILPASDSTDTLPDRLRLFDDLSAIVNMASYDSRYSKQLGI